MKKNMILFILVLSMAIKAFAITGNELNNTNGLVSEHGSLSFWIGFFVIIFIILWALSSLVGQSSRGDTNSLKRKKRWIFEDLSFLNRNSNKKPKKFNHKLKRR